METEKLYNQQICLLDASNVLIGLCEKCNSVNISYQFQPPLWCSACGYPIYSTKLEEKQIKIKKNKKGTVTCIKFV